MLITKLETEDLKSFMGKLLKENTFDNFDTRGVEVSTFTKFEISCIKNNFFYEDSISNFLTWLELKPYVVNIIKGQKQPTSIKIIFSIPEKYLEKIHQNAKALFLNLQFEEGELIFITGTTQKEFALDKSLETAWDEYITKFFVKNGININLID